MQAPKGFEIKVERTKDWPDQFCYLLGRESDLHGGWPCFSRGTPIDVTPGNWKLKVREEADMPEIATDRDRFWAGSEVVHWEESAIPSSELTFRVKLKKPDSVLTIHLLVTAVKFWSFLEIVPTVDAHEEVGCSCEIRALMQFGCKCGGFQEEQKRLKKG